MNIGVAMHLSKLSLPPPIHIIIGGNKNPNIIKYIDDGNKRVH